MRKKRQAQQLDKFYADKDAPPDVAVPLTGYKFLQIRTTKVPTSMPLTWARIMSDPLSLPWPIEFFTEHHMLMSSYSSTFWMPEGVDAGCNISSLSPTSFVEGDLKHEKDQIPHPNCTCGIYAYDILATMWTDRPHDIHAIADGFDTTWAIVKLQLGGFVLPYTHGYRAQSAKIQSIILPKIMPSANSPYVYSNTNKLARERGCNSFGAKKKRDEIYTALAERYRVEIVTVLLE